VTDRTARAATVASVGPHPDADRLDIATVDGYPCIVKRGEFRAGDEVVYVPVDTTVPTAHPAFAFLAPRAGKDGRCRIKALRLRGVFSMGLVLPAQDIAALDVRPYEAPWEIDSSGEDAPPPSPEPPRYELAALRRFPDVLVPGEPVVVTEKLHGSNGRVYRAPDGVLHVGSHGRWKLRDGNSEWAVAVRANPAVRNIPPGICVYFECVGRVGGFPYGVTMGQVAMRVFDVFDVQTRRFFNYDVCGDWADERGFDFVPFLYVGPYDHAQVVGLAEGPSRLAPHTREGIVVRPVAERWDQRCGRVGLKHHGEGFLLR
jgi:RNA ligase (TIGR02306 family)